MNHTIRLINSTYAEGIQELISENVWADCVITSFNRGYFKDEKDLLTLGQYLRAVLSNDGTVYIKAQVKYIPVISYAFERAGFQLKNILVVPVIPVTKEVHSRPQKYVDEDLEYFLFFVHASSPTMYMKPVNYKDKYDCYYSAVWSWFDGNSLIDVYRMMMKISTDHSQVILDPFMGTGNVGKAAILQDRDFIGIEPNRIIFDKTKAMLDELGE